MTDNMPYFPVSGMMLDPAILRWLLSTLTSGLESSQPLVTPCWEWTPTHPLLTADEVWQPHWLSSLGPCHAGPHLGTFVLSVPPSEALFPQREWPVASYP